MTTERIILDASSCSMSVLRATIDEGREDLRKSLAGGKKVDPTHRLIAPPSDSRTDAWGALCDKLASFTADNTGRLDAGETALFATMLKYQVAQYMMTLYPAAVVRSWGLNVDRSAPPGAKTVSATRLEVLGKMSLASSLSNDAPLTTIQAHEDTWDPAEYFGAVEWSISQLEASSFGGLPLEMEMVNGLALIAEQNFESVAAIGEATAGIYGMLNEPNIDGVAPDTGTWSAATAEQVLVDIQKLIYDARSNCAGIAQLMPNLLIVPESLWRYLSLRHTYSNTQVREELVREFDGLMIRPWNLSNLADAAGTGPRLLVGSTAAIVSRIFEPLPFTLYAPQQQGLKFRAYARQKLGGFALHHKHAFKYMDGC